METKGPRFVKHVSSGPNPYLTFITTMPDGVEKEFSMWDLLNKYGPNRVLEMRSEFPEVEE